MSRISNSDDPRLCELAMVRPGAPIMMSEERSSSIAAEQFRTLAVEMGQRIKSNEAYGYVLGITGPESDVGKTLTCLNLVLTIAPPGTLKRMLLIECDLFSPSLHEYLDVDPETQVIATSGSKESSIVVIGS